MIPKTIHYCWFGGKPLPKLARKCIASWGKFFPDYQIIEWNESNFDVHKIPYISEAYTNKKYAFVSDYARFLVLYLHGGLYFDTDVEIIHPMDDIIAAGSFMGLEPRVTPEQERLYVNPGVGLGCESGNSLWKEIIALYDGFPNFSLEVQGTVCRIVTGLLEKKGVKLHQEILRLEDVTIYPSDYFCPQAMIGAPVHLTKNTRSIHHFDCSWLPWHVRLKTKMICMLPEWMSDRLRSWKASSPR